MVFTAVLITAGAVWGDRREPRQSSGAGLHQCTLPAFDRNAANNCSAEAAAYAAALDDLDQAQQQADIAYAAWYECEHGVPPENPEPPPPQSPTYSILER